MEPLRYGYLVQEKTEGPEVDPSGCDWLCLSRLEKFTVRGKPVAFGARTSEESPQKTLRRGKLKRGGLEGGNEAEHEIREMTHLCEQF